MKFDTIIIGGGLSGLICGIQLMKKGQRCVIISSGQSALHFSSGSFDLLNMLPDGTLVDNPQMAVKELIKLSPSHPYSKLGENKFTELAENFQNLLKNIGLDYQGDSKANHFRITPMGTLKPTWLSSSNFAVSESGEKLPWQKVSLFNIAGFLDFYPQFIMDELSKIGVKSELHLFSIPDIDRLRRNPSELRSTNIARVLDKASNRDELIRTLRQASPDTEAIVLPACLGLENNDIVSELQNIIGKPIILIPTLPPSIVGIRTQQYLKDYFIHQGGVYMLGDTIKKADITNNHISAVYSYNHGDIPFRADNVVLSTGSYFSQGLIANRDKVYEPIFDLDVSYTPERQKWYTENIFENQAYQQFGVKTNNTFNALKSGDVIDNLYVAGAILEGFNPVKEGSGAGVSVLSAMYIAERIIEKEGGK